MNISEFVSSVNNDIAKAYAIDNDCLKDSDKLMQMFINIFNSGKYHEFLFHDLQRISCEARGGMYYADLNNDYTGWVSAKTLHGRCHYLSNCLDKKEMNELEQTSLVYFLLDNYKFNYGSWEYEEWRLGNPDLPKTTFSYTPPNQDSQESNSL